MVTMFTERRARDQTRHARKRGALAGTAGSRDQDQAGAASHHDRPSASVPVRSDWRPRRGSGGNWPRWRRNITGIPAKPAQIIDLQGKVELPFVLQLRPLSFLQGIERSPCILRRQDGGLRSAADDTGDPHHRRRPGGQMKIGSALLGGKHQKIHQVMSLHKDSNERGDSVLPPSSQFP